MRILHFNQHGTHAGGVEGYIADVSAALSQAGHATSLVYFTPHQGLDLLPHSICVPVEEASKPQDEVYEHLERALDSLQPDIAYIHAIYQPEVVRWIADRLPAIAYVHSPYLVCPGYAHYWRISEQACEHAASMECLRYAQTERCCFGKSPVRHIKRLRRVKASLDAYKDLNVLVGSRYMRELLALNELSDKHIGILPPVLFSDLPVTSEPEPDTVLFAGRIVREKGLHLLIEALALVGAPWKLRVAGDGDDLAHCRELAHTLHIADRIHFMGWQDAAGMADLYRQCTVVAVPSLWPEPYGRIGPEAFFHGRPVVAFDVGGVRDWLEEGVTGFLVPPANVQALADAIERHLTSPLVGSDGKEVQEQARRLWSAGHHLSNLLSHPEMIRATG